MNTRQAIETKYKGYRFRSRLEARWAVFLDKMHEPWEYEKEGFRLSNGEFYLPDFWLPRLHVWLEIKGQKPTEQELERCRLLRDSTEAAVILFMGLPDQYLGWLFCWDVNGSAGAGEFETGLSSTSYDPFNLCLMVETHKDLYADPLFQREIPNDECVGHVEYMAEEARAARFEHGEEGT